MVVELGPYDYLEFVLYSRLLVQGIAFDIWWVLALESIAMLVIAIGLIATVVTSKHKELIAKKRQLEELAISERKYRNLFEHSSAGMVRLTADQWNIVDANQALFNMFQANELEDVQKVLTSIPPQNKEHIVKQLLSAGTIEDFETILHRNNGSDIWISFSASFLSSERYIEAVVIDISARLQAEEKIREQAKLLDLAPDAILVLDLDNKVRYWNKSAESVYGYQPLEVIGKDITELIYEEVEISKFHLAAKLTMQHADWAGELFQIKKNGTVVITDCRWTLVSNPAGEPSGILQVCTDITERKRMEAKFLQAQRVESIGIFASGIAHDLSNTLAPMLVGVEVLKRKLHDQQSQRLLKTIESSAKYGSEMVYQVLSFVKGVKGTYVKLNPLKVVKDVTRILSHIISRNIDVVSRVPDKISPVTGDETQLHQVLVNLCTNARDAMPQGGKLTLSVENASVTKEMAQEHTDGLEGLHVMFSVRDTGIGIPQSVIHKIFEPFYTTKEIGKGTGLGLSICLGIIKGHKGFMTVESIEGKGTTFKIFLPTSSVLNADVQEGKLQEEFHSKIIFITNSDDEKSRTLVDGLEDHGYEPLFAVGKSQALDLLFQNLEYTQIVILNGFSKADNLLIIEETRNVKPLARFVVVSNDFGLDTIKEKKTLPEPEVLKQSDTIELLLETIERLTLGETGSK